MAGIAFAASLLERNKTEVDGTAPIRLPYRFMHVGSANGRWTNTNCVG